MNREAQVSYLSYIFTEWFPQDCFRVIVVIMMTSEKSQKKRVEKHNFIVELRTLVMFAVKKESLLYW